MANAPTSAPETSFLRNPRVRSILWQVLLCVLIAAAVAGLVHLARHRLRLTRARADEHGTVPSALDLAPSAQ